uniref:Uncharacterized protein n=1 Tax=Cacopsylla melanoneura TaxID=428564 RepID=A0A8D8V2G5_9HEMI
MKFRRLNKREDLKIQSCLLIKNRMLFYFYTFEKLFVISNFCKLVSLQIGTSFASICKNNCNDENLCLKQISVKWRVDFALKNEPLRFLGNFFFFLFSIKVKKCKLVSTKVKLLLQTRKIALATFSESLVCFNHTF